MHTTTVTPCTLDKKRMVMEALIEALPPDHQRAFDRYYSEGAHAAQAVEGTGLTEGKFRALRDEVRQRYQAATSGHLDPQEWLDRQERLTARMDEIRGRRRITRDELIQTMREREALFGKRVQS
jgi:hypothetical protein